MKRIFILVILISCIFSACTINPSGKKVEQTSEPTDSVLADYIAENTTNLLTIYTFNSMTKYILSDGYFSGYLADKYDFDFIEYPEKEGDKYIEDLRIKLMAGDSSYDLFVLYPYNAGNLAIIEEGYFLDLNQSDLIVENMNNIFDSIKNASLVDDKIFGFPRDLFYTLYLTYDTVKLKDLGYEVDEEISLEEILVLDDKYEESTGNNLPAIKLFDTSIEKIFTQNLLYINYDSSIHHINFSNIDISKAKYIRDELYKRNMISKNVMDENINNLVGYENLILDNRYPDEYIDKPIYIFNDAKVQRSTFSMHYFCINPNSEYKELALSFLEDYGRAMRLKHITSTVQTIRYSEFIYKDESTYNNNGLDLPPPTNVNQYRLDSFGGVLENARVFWNFNGFDECAVILEQFYNDEIEEDMAKLEMQKIMNLISSEYTLD